MIENLEIFIKNAMTILPEGIEQIRRFRDNEKWLSSNYRMSIPSKANNQEQTLEKENINSFQIAKHPVTNQLDQKIMDKEKELDLTQPKVNISWYDSLLFCNRLSKYFGLTEYYVLNDDVSSVFIKPDSKGFRLPTDAEWQYACRAGKNSYQYSDIDQIAWHKGNSEGHLHNVGEK